MTRSRWLLVDWYARKQDRSTTSSDCQLRVYEQGSDGRRAAADAWYRRLQLQNKKRSLPSNMPDIAMILFELLWMLLWWIITLYALDLRPEQFDAWQSICCTYIISHLVDPGYSSSPAIANLQFSIPFLALSVELCDCRSKFPAFLSLNIEADKSRGTFFGCPTFEKFWNFVTKFRQVFNLTTNTRNHVRLGGKDQKEEEEHGRVFETK